MAEIERRLTRVPAIIKPAPFALIVWAFYLSVYFSAPLSYEGATSIKTWLFICGGLMLFVAGAVLGRVPLRRARVGSRVKVSDSVVASRVFWCTVIGLLGAACMLVDKLIFSGLDYRDGIGAVRMMRVEGVLNEEDVVRTPLIYIGWIAVSFSNVAYLLHWLYSERLSWALKVFVQSSLLGPFVFAVLYGGRFPLWIVVVLTVCALIIRKSRGLPFFPRDVLAAASLCAFSVVVVIYSAYTISDRIRHVDNTDISEYEEFFASREVDVSPRMMAVQREGGVTPWLVGQALQPVWYMVIPIYHLDLAVRNREMWSLCYGQYQVPLISTFFGVVAPRYDIRPRMLNEHKGAEFYGVYLTGLGGWLIDFGFVGAFGGIFLMGWLSGWIFQRIERRQDPGSLMLGAYILASILLSPFMALYTIANGLPILFAIIAVGWSVNRSLLRRQKALGAVQSKREIL